MSPKLPVIDQMHNAGSDRERAAILLACPYTVLWKYSHVFVEACRTYEFDTGEDYVHVVHSSMCQVRTPAGELTPVAASSLDMMRLDLVAIARHGSARDNAAHSSDPENAE